MFVGEMNQSNGYGEIIYEGIKHTHSYTHTHTHTHTHSHTHAHTHTHTHTHTGKMRGVLKEKLGRHSNAWPVYHKCGQTAYWWSRQVSVAVERTDCQ